MSGRTMSLALAVLGLAASGSVIGISPASAGTGCNGVISQAEWGCAMWDNNNGPQYPHYKRAGAPGQANAPVQIAPNAAGVISTNGSNVVSHDGASLVGNSGGTARPRN